MSIKLSPASKGLITAVAMIAGALLIDVSKEKVDPRLQYLIFLLYGLGIVWTLVAFSRSYSFTGKFSALFSQGFKCFIVVTLVMVLFTTVFIKMHPEFAEEEANYQRSELIKTKDYMPDQIDDMIAKGKKQYAIRYISASIFGYLIFGAIVTAATAALLTRRK